MSGESGDPGRRLRRVLASELSNLLVDVRVGESFFISPAETVCSCLELLIPRELSAVYPEWSSESLDGVFVFRAIRSGASQVDLAGACILITDQALTPLRVEVRMTEAGSDVAEMRIRIGEPGGGALRISGRRYESGKIADFVRELGYRFDEVQWTYDWVG